MTATRLPSLARPSLLSPLVRPESESERDWPDGHTVSLPREVAVLDLDGVAAAAWTVTVTVPVIALWAVSVAVIVWLPAVFRITPLNVCWPRSAALNL